MAIMQFYIKHLQKIMHQIYLRDSHVKKLTEEDFSLLLMIALVYLFR